MAALNIKDLIEAQKKLAAKGDKSAEETLKRLLALKNEDGTSDSSIIQPLTNKQKAAANKTNRKQRKAAKMQAKRSLTQHVNSLPKEEPTEVIETSYQEPEKTKEESAATLGVPTGVAAKVKADELEDKKTEIKISKDEIKIEKDLLKELKKLTEGIKLANKQGSLLGKRERTGISGWFGQQKDKVTTLQGLGSLVGLNRDDGSLKGAIFGSVLNSLEKRKEKKQFVKDFSELTPRGRSLSKKEAEKEALERYKVIKKETAQSEKLASKMEMAHQFGGSLGEEETSKLKSSKEALSNALDFSKGMGEKTDKTPSAIMKEESDGKSNEKELVNSSRRSRGTKQLNQLVSLGEQQLEKLNTLIELITPSEEAKLEQKKENVTKREEKKEEKKKDGNGFGGITGILGMIRNAVAGALMVIKSISGILMNFLRSMGKGLMGKAVNIGKGALNLGRTIAPHVANVARTVITNPFTAVAAGGAAATYGAAGVLASPQAESFRNTVTDINNPMLGAMAGDTAVASSILDAGSDNFDNQLQERIQKEQQLKDAPWYTRMFGIGETDYLKKKEEATSKPPVKLDNTNRVSQTNELISKDMETLKTEKDSKQNQVINNNTVVNNNTTTDNNKKQIRVPVRNQEPTYLNRTDRHFKFA